MQIVLSKMTLVWKAETCTCGIGVPVSCSKVSTLRPGGFKAFRCDIQSQVQRHKKAPRRELCVHPCSWTCMYHLQFTRSPAMAEGGISRKNFLVKTSSQINMEQQVHFPEGPYSFFQFSCSAKNRKESHFTTFCGCGCGFVRVR